MTSFILLFLLVALALLVAGISIGFILRPSVDATLLRRRREANAQALLNPFARDYRDEFNRLRDSIPVDDRELADAKPAGLVHPQSHL